MANFIESIQLPDGSVVLINAVPEGGTKGQVLVKTGEETENIGWADGSEPVLAEIATIKSDITNLSGVVDGNNEAINTALATATENLETAIAEGLATKQDNLEAGDHITIEGNIISAQSVFGAIDGNIEDQANLKEALDAKHNAFELGENLLYDGNVLHACSIKQDIMTYEADVREKNGSSITISEDNEWLYMDSDDDGFSSSQSINLGLKATWEIRAKFIYRGHAENDLKEVAIIGGNAGLDFSCPSLIFNYETNMLTWRLSTTGDEWTIDETVELVGGLVEGETYTFEIVKDGYNYSLGVGVGEEEPVAIKTAYSEVNALSATRIAFGFTNLGDGVVRTLHADFYIPETYVITNDGSWFASKLVPTDYEYVTNVYTKDEINELLEGRGIVDDNYILNTLEEVRNSNRTLNHLVKTKQDAFTVGEGLKLEEGILTAEGRKYIAGEGVEISDDFVISAEGRKYTAGKGVEISEDGVISADGKAYTAGEGIEISEDGVISSTSISARWGNIEGNVRKQPELRSMLDTIDELKAELEALKKVVDEQNKDFIYQGKLPENTLSIGKDITGKYANATLDLATEDYVYNADNRTLEFIESAEVEPAGVGYTLTFNENVIGNYEDETLDVTTTDIEYKEQKRTLEFITELEDVTGEPVNTDEN
jgi:hypothetical protein